MAASGAPLVLVVEGVEMVELGPLRDLVLILSEVWSVFCLDPLFVSACVEGTDYICPPSLLPSLLSHPTGHLVPPCDAHPGSHKLRPGASRRA